MRWKKNKGGRFLSDGTWNKNYWRMYAFISLNHKSALWVSNIKKMLATSVIDWKLYSYWRHISFILGFGITEPIGHIDFYPNGGSTQPGCTQASSPNGGSNDLSYQQVVKFVGCNHERSYEYFTESVAPSCPFMAVQCESYDVSILFGTMFTG